MEKMPPPDEFSDLSPAEQAELIANGPLAENDGEKEFSSLENVLGELED
jgi:hypothetical protein